MSEPENTLKAIRERLTLTEEVITHDEWTAAAEADALALDVKALLRRLGADEEPDPELGYTPPMVVLFGDEEIFAHCGDCEAPLGSIRPDGKLDTLAANWERHTMTVTHG